MNRSRSEKRILDNSQNLKRLKFSNKTNRPDLALKLRSECGKRIENIITKNSDARSKEPQRKTRTKNFFTNTGLNLAHPDLHKELKKILKIFSKHQKSCQSEISSYNPEEIKEFFNIKT